MKYMAYVQVQFPDSVKIKTIGPFKARSGKTPEEVAVETAVVNHTNGQDFELIAVEEYPRPEGFDYSGWVGRKVRKCSGKPFKSGNQLATVKSLETHPKLDLPVFRFEEDDSIVEVRRCFVET